MLHPGRVILLLGLMLWASAAMAQDTLRLEPIGDTALLPYATTIDFVTDHKAERKAVRQMMKITQARRDPSDSVIGIQVENSPLNADEAASVFVKYFPSGYALTQDPLFLTVTDFCLFRDSAGGRIGAALIGYRGDSAFVARNFPGSNHFDFLYLVSGVDHTGNGAWEPSPFHVLSDDYDFDGSVELFFYLSCGRDKGPRLLFCIDIERLAVEWSLPISSSVTTDGVVSCRDSVNPGIMVCSYGPDNRVSDPNFDDRFGYFTRIDRTGQIVFNHQVSPMFGGPGIQRLPGDSLFVLFHHFNLPEQAPSDTSYAWLSIIDGQTKPVRSVALQETIISLALVDVQGDSALEILAVGRSGRVNLFAQDLQLLATSPPTHLEAFIGEIVLPGRSHPVLVFHSRGRQVIYSKNWECLGVIPVGGDDLMPAAYAADNSVVAFATNVANGFIVGTLSARPVSNRIVAILWRFRNWFVAALGIVSISLIVVNVRRRRAMDALAKMEARNEAMLNASPDSMLRISADGVFLDYQASRQNELLASGDQFLGKPISEILPPTLARQLLDAIALTLQTGMIQSFEFALSVGGTPQDYEVRMVASGRHEVLAIVRNISDRKARELAIQRQAQILQQVNNAIIVTNLQGIITDFNHGAERIMGFSAEDVIGQPISSIYPADSWARLQTDMAQSLQETGRWEGEVETLTKSGGRIFSQLSLTVLRDGNGLPIGRVGYGLDITERKLAETALRESEEKFRAVTESMSAGITIFGNDRLLYCNPASVRITGFTLEELSQKNFWDIIHPEFRELVKQRGQGRLSGEEIPPRYAVKIVTKQGAERWIDYSAQVIQFLGRPAVLGTAIDITDRINAEAELGRVYQERYQQVREIAGGVSHEIYNSLFPATTTLYKLRERLQAGSESRDEAERDLKLIQLAEQAIARAIHMTESVTRYSRLEANRAIEDVPLTDVVAEILEHNRSRCDEHKIRIEVDIPETAVVACSHPHLYSLLNNVVVNAIDALLEVENRVITITAHCRQEHIQIQIRDTGPGISAENLPRVFNAFYSTKPRSGTGLGLAMVKKIAEMYGGSVRVSSIVDTGTCFDILLPRVMTRAGEIHAD